jgi:hypothetical protein
VTDGRRRRLAALTPLGVLLLVGCGPLPDEDLEEPEAETRVLDPELVDVHAWTLSGAEDDPFPDHRPSEVRCPDVGWQVEGTSLEVDTGACLYLSVEQPLMRDVDRGEHIVVDMWHQPLHAAVGGFGHVALVVGEGPDAELLWEREVFIPGPSEIWSDAIEAPRALAAGERVVFHLHNHGANTWNLGGVRVDERRP